MSSPKAEVFFLFNLTSGAVLTGQGGISFITYKDDLGANLSQPTITEIGGGAYMFTPTFADPERGIVYVIDTGVNANPTKVTRFMRPEDWSTDILTNVFQGVGSVVTILIVRAVDGRHVDIIFNTRVDPISASNPANYSITGLTVSAADKITDQTYRLTTSQQNTGTSYTVTISNIGAA